tara:strand:+ start:51649 stop:52629 length:981 start_codon:yes stop_codon:yes gene_type:complete
MRPINIFLTLICSLFFATQLYAADALKPIDDIVAIVNAQIITDSQLQARIKSAKDELQQEKIKQPSQQVLENQILNMMIDQKIQLQAAARLNIEVSPTEVKHAFTVMAQQRNTTPQAMLQAIHQSGLTTQQFTQQLHQQITISKLQQQLVASHITVKPGEIEDFIRTMQAKKDNLLYHVEDILIALPEAPTPTEISKATDTANIIVKKLQSGANFKTLAVAQSSGQQALKGGDLGWRSLAELPGVFASKIQHMKNGAVAGPIRAPNGIHVIKLAGIKRGKAIANQDQMKQQVGQMLFKRKFEQQLQSWSQQMRDTAYVKIMLPKNK